MPLSTINTYESICALEVISIIWWRAEAGTVEDYYPIVTRCSEAALPGIDGFA